MSGRESDAESIPNDAASVFDVEEDYLSDTDEDEEQPFTFRWDQEFQPRLEEFSQQPNTISSELAVTSLTSALEIFEIFFTEDIVEDICRESARYAEQKNLQNFTPFDSNEFWRFLAVHLSMGIIRKASIKDYWSTNYIISTPFFHQMMSRDRYLMILRSLHFVDNNTIPPDNRNKFIKLGSLLEKLLQNWKRAVHVGEYLCLDESLVAFQGRLSIKQYNPKKRARFGVKLFVLADCASKLILDILPYQGASTKLKDRALVQSMGFGGAAVMTLLDPYLDCGHKVVIDNYFNSPTLARALAARQTYVLGTVQKRRKGMPSGINMTRKLKRGEVRTFSNGAILVERWADRRDVCMLNTFLPHTMEEIEAQNPRNNRVKPGSVLVYNSKMGIIDDSDKTISPNGPTRKTCKWYRKIAFHLWDLTVYNASLVYGHTHGKKPAYVDFVKQLVNDIVEKYPNSTANNRGRPPTTRSDARLLGKHFPVEAPRNQNTGCISRANCHYCWVSQGKRKQVRYVCSNEQCKKRLCLSGVPNCFTLYHTVSHIRTRRHSQMDPLSNASMNLSDSLSLIHSESVSLFENSLE